jgi:hypothetical protein
MALQVQTGEHQKPLRQKVQSYIDTIATGPLCAREATKSGLVDGVMYQQRLLNFMAQNGIKTWSVRKYLDAMIAQTIFDDIDMDIWVLPQIFRWGKGKQAGLVKEGGEEREGRRMGMFGKSEQASSRVVVVMNEQAAKERHTPGSPVAGPLDKTEVIVKCVIPRKVAVVYLDNAIEGYNLPRSNLTFVGKEDLVEKLHRHI